MSIDRNDNSAAVILHAPTGAEGTVYGTTVTNATAPTYTLIPYLAIIARHNPMGLAELFNHTAWDVLNAAVTERGSSQEVYGVGFLDPTSQRKVTEYTKAGIENLAVDTYILAGSTVIFVSKDIIGGRSLTELLDPTLFHKYEDWEYAQFDLLDPVSWPDAPAIKSFYSTDLMVRRRKQNLRDDRVPVLDFMG